MDDTEDDLVRQHLGVARHVATQLCRKRRRADFEEAYTAALESLLVAIRSFDPERGVPMPAWLFHKTRLETMDVLRAVHGRRGNRRRRALLNLRQLYRPDPDARGATNPIADTLVDSSPAPFYAAEVADTVRRLLLELPANERAVLVGSYLYGRTLKSIGEDLGLSETRCSQLRSAALAALRSRPELVALVED